MELFVLFVKTFHCALLHNYIISKNKHKFYIIIAKRIYNVIQSMSPAELNQTHPDASHLIINLEDDSLTAIEQLTL